MLPITVNSFCKSACNTVGVNHVTFLHARLIQRINYLDVNYSDMVRATVIIPHKKERYCDARMTIICPFCDSVLDDNDIFYHDYVSDNWVYFCKCDGGLSGALGAGHFICQYLETENDECSIKMDPEEVKSVCEKYNLGYKKYFRGYRMGILKLKFVLPAEQIPDTIDECDSDGDGISVDEYNCPDLIRAAYTDKSNTRGFQLDGCYSLNEAREKTGNSLCHDGSYLGYIGECTECGEEYTAVIWGD